MARRSSGPVAITITSQALTVVGLAWALVVASRPLVIFCAVFAALAFALGGVTLWRAWRWRLVEKRMAAMTRPRFGWLHTRAGIAEPLVFHPVAADQFVALHAGDESPVTLRPGDRLEADARAPGQSIVFRTDPPGS